MLSMHEDIESAWADFVRAIEYSENWIAEFYPITAYACEAGRELEHSILKWTGIAKAHEDGMHAPIRIGSLSCALCKLYLGGTASIACLGCPILETTGVRCSEPGSAYHEWTPSGDPLPLLQLLKDLHVARAAKSDIVS